MTDCFNINKGLEDCHYLIVPFFMGVRTQVQECVVGCNFLYLFDFFTMFSLCRKAMSMHPNGIEVPVTWVPITEEGYFQLREQIDPLRDSELHGVDIYLEVLSFLATKQLANSKCKIQPVYWSSYNVTWAQPIFMLIIVKFNRLSARLVQLFDKFAIEKSARNTVIRIQ